MRREEALVKLRDLKPWLESEYGVTRVRLFGSHARDEARANSDIDLLVDFSGPIGLRFFDLEEQLTQRLGTPVSIASESRFNRVILRHVLTDAIDA